MINIETLLRDDHQFIWHPCSQMKDYEQFKPLVIKQARGSYIELQNGHTVIDAISSWWCKSLGHHHPEIKKALLSQVEQFEHVIFANTTHPTIVELSKRLAALCPSLDKVFFAGDGSCAVEIALKMSLHTRVIQHEPERNQFIALKNGYHGETAGAMSVSDLGLYKAPYESLLFKTVLIEPPYVTGITDPLWHNCESAWEKIEKSLRPYAHTATAIILEPLLQGAAGMQIYSQDFLKRLRQWTEQHNIHLIADEIMTGIGRTGKMLACEHANIIPDFMCLSKGLTSGWMPFSAVLTKTAIYELFYDDYQTGKSFLHSHSFSGHALGASVALATLTIFEKENIIQHAAHIGDHMYQAMQTIADKTQKITNIRHLGAVVAADLVNPHHKERLGFHFYQQAIKNGALLRPLGNTIYWLPPLNTSFETLDELSDITLKTLNEIS